MGNPLDDWSTLRLHLQIYIQRWILAGPDESIDDVFASKELSALNWKNIKGITSVENRGLVEEITATGSEAMAARFARPGDYHEAKEQLEFVLGILNGEGSESTLVKTARSILR